MISLSLSLLDLYFWTNTIVDSYGDHMVQYTWDFAPINISTMIDQEIPLEKPVSAPLSLYFLTVTSKFRDRKRNTY